MTSPTLDPPISRDPSSVRRVAIGAGGLLLLGVGVLITFGTALIGVGAIVVAWYYLRRRQQQFTRTRAWVVSVVATVVPLIVVFVVTMLKAPPITAEQRKEAVARRAQSRDSMPGWLKKLSPSQQQAGPAADSIAERLMDNKGFMVWFMAMGAMIGSMLVGVFSGSIAWGATMMLFRAIQGEWLGAGGEIAPAISGIAS